MLEKYSFSVIFGQAQLLAQKREDQKQPLECRPMRQLRCWFV